MLLRTAFFTIALLFAAAAHAEGSAPDATPNLAEAIGKSGDTWENFYKFTAFVEAGKPARLIYQNLEKFDLHQQYLSTLPGFQGMSRDQIDALTYRPGPNRKAFTGVVVIHAGDDAIHRSRFSLAMEDIPTVEVISQIAALIKKSVGEEADYLGDALDFELLPHQEKAFGTQAGELARQGISLYRSHREATSISYTQAWSTGVLVTVSDQADLDAKVAAGEVGPGSILYAKEALREIPMVAGVISNVPLTPASHTVLLSQMYGIPVVFIRDAETAIKPLAGRRIFLSANGDPSLPMDRRNAEVSVDPTDQDLAELQRLKVRRQLTMDFRPEELRIRAAKELGLGDVGAYGGKASQMGILLRQIPQNTVSKALAIPLGYSRRFLDTALATDGQTLANMIARLLSQATDSQIETVAAQIQDEIKNATFPYADLKLIEDTVREAFTGYPVKVRFRSTSNVEDGREFNGAGLYDSTGVWLVGRKRDDVGSKLKKVIASLYNARAIIARRKFGIDESKVGMGILVHPAFLDEIGNGVIRFMADKERNRFQFEIVTLKGDDEQVTHATSAGAAEVITGMGDYGPMEVSINLSVEQPYEGYSKQRTLFPSQTYLQLAQLMAKVAREYEEAGQGIDIESEFKLMPDGGIFIKQVRRVPHPVGGKTADGSSFLVLANSATFTPGNSNVTLAFADLWRPRRIQVEMDSFTENQIRGNRVPVKKVSFELGGKTYALSNPKAVSKFDDEYASYEIEIDLPNEKFPGLKLILSNTNGLRPHSLNSPSAYAQLVFSESDLRVLKKAGFADKTYVYYENGQPAGLAPSREGKIHIKAGRTVKIEGLETKFYGDGDARSVRIGRAIISGLSRKSLTIPGRAIGYGANHHQGDESYVFDLYGIENLSAREKEALGGRYLYLTQKGSDESANALLIKENGEIKKLGKWSAEEDCEEQLRP
jgi:hypothetical protein